MRALSPAAISESMSRGSNDRWTFRRRASAPRSTTRPSGESEPTRICSPAEGTKLRSRMEPLRHSNGVQDRPELPDELVLHGCRGGGLRPPQMDGAVEELLRVQKRPS